MYNDLLILTVTFSSVKTTKYHVETNKYNRSLDPLEEYLH